MENLVWAISLWTLVLILIPLQRLKEIWPVAIISFIWLFIIEYIFVHLGYIQFTKYLIIIGGVPPFHLLGGSAGGILLMNWMQRNQLYKILLVSSFSGLLVLSAHLFEKLDAFTYLNGFNHALDFVLNVAGLSFLVWISLALVGEETIYLAENKTRFIK
jgi:hypothetical protein